MDTSNINPALLPEENIADEDFAALLQRADAALFRAKTAGRDRITVSD